jgi:hypothetical protein
MPKRKSPYKVKKDQQGWYVKAGNLKLYYTDSYNALVASITANEVYAHGYRNGMRAGRKG